MIVGIPKEVKDNEFRIAATPEGVRELVDAGQTVLIEEGAGLGSSLSEERYKRSGAQFVSSAEDVWRGADMILKVKEPIASEYALMREGQILSALGDGLATIPAMVKKIYADVPEKLHMMAAQSVESHLKKLAREGRVQEAPQRDAPSQWTLVR